MAGQPDLVREYAEYVRIREAYAQGGKVDMSGADSVHPTTLLPLSGLVAANPDCYAEPAADAPRRYASAVLGPRRTALPDVSLAEMPSGSDTSGAPLDGIYAIGSGMRNVGARSAFAYIVNELADNIYEHSRFERALVLGRRYEGGLVDISFFDDGITIPRSLRRGPGGGPGGMILGALGGATARKGRGYGLRTTFSLATDGLGSDFFIASGEEAVHGSRDGSVLTYRLSRWGVMDGTLITVRMPLDPHPVNVYNYVE